jgi:ribosomal protein L11 methyltransferase
MQWIELTVQAHPEAVESVSELLMRYTHGGVAIEEPIELLDDGQDYRILPGHPVKIHAYLAVDGREEEARQRIAEGLWHLASIGAGLVGELETRIIAEEDWAYAWREHYQVTHIGRRLVIRPSWLLYTPQADEVVMTLDPGMAFGTGLHPTTRMCLEELERRVQPGMCVLDLGTGSGILALAAALLGAAHVDAYDISDVAVASARENVALNHLTGRISVFQGTLDEERSAQLAGRYHLLVVNILAGVIAALAPFLAMVLAPGGLLIASGILEERRPEVEERLLASGLCLVERSQSDDWLLLVMRKPAQ